MKQLTSLVVALLLILQLVSCSKGSDSPIVQDMCPNVPGIQTSTADCPPAPPISAPTGTVLVNPSSQSIAYDGTVTFNCYFQNSTSVYCNGTYVGKDTFSFTTTKLKADSSFTFRAVGSGGEKTLPKINITVGQDPRIGFLTVGAFVHDSTIARPLGGVWFSSPNGTINNYNYFYNGFTGPPGNNATALNGTTPINFFWYFTGESGFWAHGIECDQFVITGPNTFKTHEYGPVIVGGIPVDGEYWRFYKRL